MVYEQIKYLQLNMHTHTHTHARVRARIACLFPAHVSANMGWWPDFIFMQDSLGYQTSKVQPRGGNEREEWSKDGYESKLPPRSDTLCS